MTQKILSFGPKDTVVWVERSYRLGVRTGGFGLGHPDRRNYARLCPSPERSERSRIHDEKKIPGRMEWAHRISSVKNENNWAVEVLPKCAEYDLGYNYTECGICKLCRDEGCPELAKYMCRLDYIIADMMGADLVRTMTLAQGGDMCDFRYSLKNRT